MVKSAAARTAKIQAKNDPTATMNRLTAQLDTMNSNAATAQADGATVAATVRGILDQYSVGANFSSTFQAFANELASKKRKYSGVAYVKEGGLVLQKWKLRCTLNGSIPADFVGILTAICNSYGITYA
jgi:hypothetical protein